MSSQSLQQGRLARATTLTAATNAVGIMSQSRAADTGVSPADAFVPNAIPEDWWPLFLEFTGPSTADEWGLRAAKLVVRYRKAHSVGPTFAELFENLASSTCTPPPVSLGRPSGQSRALYCFRHHVAVHWRRLGWIDWDHGGRSLRGGRTFRAASRQWRARRELGNDATSGETAN